MPIIAAIVAGITLIGCGKPEVVPTPTATANLKVAFEGIINGNDVEFTKNVQGFYHEATNTITYDSATATNAIQYFSHFRSNQTGSSIGIGIGSLDFDPNVSANASQDAFFNFFAQVPETPPFSNNARAGFNIMYSDEAGRFYYSDDTNPGTVEFLGFTELQDENGDYVQYSCSFSGEVYHKDEVEDTIIETAQIQDALLLGWFKR